MYLIINNKGHSATNNSRREMTQLDNPRMLRIMGHSDPNNGLGK